MNKVFTCYNCGKTFENSTHHGIKKFCCRACQTEYLRKHPSLPKKVSKFTTAKELEAACIEIIAREQRYVTMDELSKLLHICSKEFPRLGVSITTVNSNAGFSKPVSCCVEIVKKYLAKHGYSCETEVSFADLISSKGMHLRYDLQITGTNVLIEVDGRMHNANHDWNNEQRISNDRLKETYAQKNKYALVRIPAQRAEYLTNEYLDNLFMGNQYPEVRAIASNGSETDSSTPAAEAAANANSQHGVPVKDTDGEGIVQSCR